jgi:hypothetical protein
VYMDTRGPRALPGMGCNRPESVASSKFRWRGSMAISKSNGERGSPWQDHAHE